MINLTEKECMTVVKAMSYVFHMENPIEDKFMDDLWEIREKMRLSGLNIPGIHPKIQELLNNPASEVLTDEQITNQIKESEGVCLSL